MTSADKDHYPKQEIRCIAHKEQYGVALRCIRPHRHAGRHHWERDDNIYLLGRLDPDNKFDQMFVEAWNKGANRDSSR